MFRGAIEISGCVDHQAGNRRCPITPISEAIVPHFLASSVQLKDGSRVVKAAITRGAIEVSSRIFNQGGKGNLAIAPVR